VDGFSFGRWGCGRGGIYYLFPFLISPISRLRGAEILSDGHAPAGGSGTAPAGSARFGRVREIQIFEKRRKIINDEKRGKIT